MVNENLEKRENIACFFRVKPGTDRYALTQIRDFAPLFSLNHVPLDSPIVTRKVRIFNISNPNFELILELLLKYQLNFRPIFGSNVRKKSSWRFLPGGKFRSSPTLVSMKQHCVDYYVRACFLFKTHNAEKMTDSFR